MHAHCSVAFEFFLLSKPVAALEPLLPAGRTFGVSTLMHALSRGIEGNLRSGLARKRNNLERSLGQHKSSEAFALESLRHKCKRVPPAA